MVIRIMVQYAILLNSWHTVVVNVSQAPASQQRSFVEFQGQDLESRSLLHQLSSICGITFA
jgi:hypothetical protein